MEELILFIMCFIFVFLIYEFFIVPKAIKNKRNNKKQPIEVKYLVSKYHLNLKKINYKALLHIISLVSSFDIAVIVSVTMLFNNYLIQILLALIIMVPIILISYYFVYIFYKRKEMIKDE